MLLAFAVLGTAQAQNQGFTFSVDDVKVADAPIPERYGENLTFRWTFDHTCLASSFADEWLVDGDNNAFFKMITRAYAEHRPISLSPDVVWIVICHGYSLYVNADPEHFRHYLVNHEGKQTLEITTDLYSTTTQEKVEAFAALIGQQTRGDLEELMTCNFSTSGQMEQMVSRTMLMETVKEYIDLVEYFAVCGIPSVTLEGTPDDWRLLREKTRRLADFGVSKWVNKLDKILEQFVRASEGNPDIDFWRDMVVKGRPKHYNTRGGCGGKREILNGWFLDFFPFDSNGRTPRKVTYTTPMPHIMTNVPITQIIIDDNKTERKKISLRAGIVGIRQDSVTLTLRAELGWLVVE